MKVAVAFLPRLMCTLCCEDGVHMVDVVETYNGIEMWLYHRNYDVKRMLFGVSKDQLERENQSFDDLVELVAANLESESYLANYDAEYTDTMM